MKELIKKIYQLEMHVGDSYCEGYNHALEDVKKLVEEYFENVEFENWFYHARSFFRDDAGRYVFQDKNTRYFYHEYVLSLEQMKQIYEHIKPQ